MSGDERANPAGNAIQILREVTEVSPRLQQQSHIAAAGLSAAFLLKLAECDAPIVQHLGQFEDRARKACGGASRRSGIKVVSFPSNLVTMTTIVGVFDNARNLNKAVERLARAGFEDTVYDDAIVEGEAGNGGGSLVFAPGYAPAMVLGSAEPESRPKRSKHGQHTIVEAFKAHLAEYDVPAEVIQAYAVMFYANGECAGPAQKGQVATALSSGGTIYRTLDPQTQNLDWFKGRAANSVAVPRLLKLEPNVRRQKRRYENK